MTRTPTQKHTHCLTARGTTQSLWHLRWSLCLVDFILSVCNAKRWGGSININCHYVKWDIPERGLPQSPHANIVCTTIFERKLLQKLPCECSSLLRAIEEARFFFSLSAKADTSDRCAKTFWELNYRECSITYKLRFQVPVFKPLGRNSDVFCFLYHLLCVTVVHATLSQSKTEW